MLTTDEDCAIILLVEDEPADAHLVRVAFRESGFKVSLHHVSDGVEALEFLRHGDRFLDAPRPDLILLDLNMPRMNGREFLEVFKNDDALSDIPVVVLTTSEVERDVMASYRLGVAGYIVKPLDVDEFVESIRRLQDYWFNLVRMPQKRD